MKSQALAWTFRLLPVLGLALLSLGIVGDVRDWWDDLGYLSNMLAGATAACFGIPFAIWGVQWFLRNDTANRHRQEIAKQIGQTLHSIEVLVDEELGGTQIDSVLVRCNSAQDAMYSLVVMRPEKDLDRGDAVKRASEALDEALECLRAAYTVRSWSSRQEGWLILVRRWTYLSETLLPQAESLGLVTAGNDRQYSEIGRILSLPANHPARLDLLTGKFLWFTMFEESMEDARAAASEGLQACESSLSEYKSQVLAARDFLDNAIRGFGELQNLRRALASASLEQLKVE